MLRIVFSTGVIWLACVVALGQRDAAELARLRTQMGVSQSTPITIGGAHTLPAERPLKVYVSTAGDRSAYERRVNLSEPRKNLSDALLTVLKRPANTKK